MKLVRFTFDLQHPQLKGIQKVGSNAYNVSPLLRRSGLPSPKNHSSHRGLHPRSDRGFAAVEHSSRVHQQNPIRCLPVNVDAVVLPFARFFLDKCKALQVVRCGRGLVIEMVLNLPLKIYFSMNQNQRHTRGLLQGSPVRTISGTRISIWYFGPLSRLGSCRRESCPSPQSRWDFRMTGRSAVVKSS